MPAHPPQVAVSAIALRELFNAGGYAARLADGTLRAVVVKSRHPSAPKARVPFCTASQFVLYLDESGHEVAAVHQYVLPDGTLGASGQPDPKRLLKDGTLYLVVA
jgi:hypothetical protein